MYVGSIPGRLRGGAQLCSDRDRSWPRRKGPILGSMFPRIEERFLVNPRDRRRKAAPRRSRMSAGIRRLSGPERHQPPGQSDGERAEPGRLPRRDLVHRCVPVAAVPAGRPARGLHLTRTSGDLCLRVQVRAPDLQAGSAARRAADHPRAAPLAGAWREPADDRTDHEAGREALQPVRRPHARSSHARG